MIVAGMVAAAVIAAFLLGRVTSDESCGDREVRVDGECEAIMPGESATSISERRAESVASQLVDTDPPAGALSAHCAFQGIAAGRLDVHACVVHHFGAPMTMRLTNERDSRRYRVLVLTDPDPKAPDPEEFAGRTFDCTYQGNPPCPSGDSGG
jgi:hypothetical protein